MTSTASANAFASTVPVFRAEDDLALTVPLEGVQQIEASAGTGKTFTIAGLYVRLLVERKLPLREILVMTFTKAATDELRQRLRQRLALCAQLAHPECLQAVSVEGLDAEQQWVRALLRRALAAGEDPAALARRLKLAVLGMDEAAIFTIHGFCTRVLREHAALVDGASSAAELASDDDLLADFAADAWLRSAAEDDVLMREALLHLGESPTALARTLKDLIDFSGDVEPAASSVALTMPENPDVFQAAVFDAWDADGDAALALFERAWYAGDMKLADFPRGSVEVLNEIAWQLRARMWPVADALSRFSATAIGEGMKQRAPPFAGHPAFDAIESWCVACNAWQDAVRARIPVVLHRVLDAARTWLAQRKRALVRMSYADQIELVHAGLSADARGQLLLEALRRQYPVALVDEFQDTDARQFEIFARMYVDDAKPDFGTLFCIGDPKQAIYGFRGGDVHAYLRARTLARGCSRLAYNYRSAPGLLAASAALFGGRDDVFIEQGIAFEPVQWGGTTAADALRHADAPITPMTLWRLPDEPIKGGQDAVRAWLSGVCAGTIAQLLAPGASTLEGDPLRPRHIAVLVNTNDEAMQVHDDLAAHGVPAVCLRRESVFASTEASELKRILDALLTPRNGPVARGALATRLLGRTLSDLKAMRDDDLDWRAELDDLRLRWFERGVLAMLERLGERHAKRLLQQPDGERCLSNLLQLGDALQAEAHRLATPHAQRDWLAQRIILADANNEDEQLRLQSDAERVQILTLHASKGLEYDLVFLPFAALMHARKPNMGEFARIHADDRLLKRYLGSGSSDAMDATHQADAAAIEAARREDKAEGVRKLYVGVTRARHACWLSVGSPSKQFKDGVLPWVLADGLAALAVRANGHIAITDVPQPLPVGMDLEPANDLPDARVFTRQLDRDWWVHSFSRLSEGTHGRAEVEVVRSGTPGGDATSALALADGPRGARFGNAVHSALELIDFAAWSVPLDDLPATQWQVVARALQADGFSTPLARTVAARMLSAALRTPLVGDLCLARVPADQRRAELQFHFGMAGANPEELLQLLHAHGYQRHRHAFAHVASRLAGLMNGLIDLVFVHEERWWIVDYKTNFLGERADDYAPARLPAAMAQHDYDLQYLIYSVALHRWLRQVRGADYDYQRDMGGVRYLFLRGMGVGAAGNGIFADRPPAALIEAMDALLQAPGVGA